MSYKNMALITKEYANARQNALYNFYAAVDSIGNVTVNSIDDISYANAMRTEAEKIHKRRDRFVRVILRFSRPRNRPI